MFMVSLETGMLGGLDEILANGNKWGKQRLYKAEADGARNEGKQRRDDDDGGDDWKGLVRRPRGRPTQAKLKLGVNPLGHGRAADP